MHLHPMVNIYDDCGLSLFDTINLAKCAGDRAALNAGSPDQRFKREYTSALMWADIASTYNITKHY